MHHIKLYKRDPNGGIRVWWVETVGSVHGNGMLHRTHSGLEDGAIVTSGWTDDSSPDKVSALYRKQLNQGRYHEHRKDVDKFTYNEPMLAKTYNPDKPHRSEPFYMQPKLDGLRCIASSEGLFSRTGKPFTSLNHIRQALTPFFEEHPDVILDGELYNHDLHDDFNKISGLVRRGQASAETVAKIQYHVYDMWSPEVFSQRYWFLQNYFEVKYYPTIQLVETVASHSGDPGEGPVDPDAWMAYWLEQGYEGMMYRYDLAGYEDRGKRAWQLQKRKTFFTEEFTVVSITEGNGNRSGIAGSINYVTEDGIEFDSGILGDYVYCKSLLINKDKYIGGTGTVRFPEKFPSGKPRFPVTIDLQPFSRDD